MNATDVAATVTAAAGAARGPTYERSSSRVRPARALLAAAAMALMALMALASPAARAQAAGCDQGVVRLPDGAGTVTICSALAAQVPQLSRQLAEAMKQVGSQGAQLREITRLVRGLNAVGAGLSTDRQARMLASLSAELARSERQGGDRPRRTLEDVAEQLDALRDQLAASLARESSAQATRQGLQGAVGESIAQLELRSASRQLDELAQRLAALQTDVGQVKSGVAAANESLRRIEGAVDPAVAGDRCPDLVCAVNESATLGAVRRLVDKGARLPSSAAVQAEVLKAAALSGRADRLALLDLLMREAAGTGFDRRMLVWPRLAGPGQLTPAARRLGEKVYDGARLSESMMERNLAPGDVDLARWNAVAGCLLRDSRGVSMLELAALLGDAELYAHLRRQGDELPARPLKCSPMLLQGGTASALGVKLLIDVSSGAVEVVPL